MDENQIFIEKPWLININKELDELADAATQLECWNKRSIYKIPTSVTNLKKSAYEPQIVSIGPYHYGAEHLKAMEEHKRRALLHFLKRSDQCLQALVKVLIPEIRHLKDAYDQLDPKWHQDEDKFLEVMILDGCFILEMLRTTNKPKQSKGADKPEWSEGADDRSSNDKDYASNDPIFSHHGKLYIVPYLKRDMLMLENQIPILVLKKLISIETGNEDLLMTLIFNFLSLTSPKDCKKFGNCLHILQIYRQGLLLEDTPFKSIHHKKDSKTGCYSCGGGGNRSVTELKGGGGGGTGDDIIQFTTELNGGRGSGNDIIRSATELNEAGIHIKKSKTKSLKDISFKKGVLRLPLIVIDDALESLYLNLIAFERFHVGAGNEVTSYIFFMDSIIDNARDVSLLHSCGIIQSALGSDKAVATLFNSLSKDITLEPDSSLDKVHREVSTYCQQAWHRWRANLMHTYFTNPWAILSVIAAIFLFALTIIQAVYAVLAYVKPPSSAAG